jgi:hypothetical protein
MVYDPGMLLEICEIGLAIRLVVSCTVWPTREMWQQTTQAMQAPTREQNVSVEKSSPLYWTATIS